jgi:hypothetical protein
LVEDAVLVDDCTQPIEQGLTKRTDDGTSGLWHARVGIESVANLAVVAGGSAGLEVGAVGHQVEAGFAL